MSKYIDIHKLKIPKGTVTDVKLRGVPAIIELLEKQPIVDAVEVVRCKDCKHRNRLAYCPLCGVMVTPDDYFCADGERKDEE